MLHRSLVSPLFGVSRRCSEHRQDPVRSAMDFLPWTRIVDRYSPGPDAFLRRAIPVLAFAQLTYRESLRDIETFSSTVEGGGITWASATLPLRRSTLADANERRDWRIHAALAQRLITQARTLYVDEELGLDDQYRLRPGLDDHRSVPVGLSVGALPHHQGGGEDAHAARPAGQHSVLSTSRMASCTTMPSICSCRKPSHLRRGSWLRRLCPPLCVAPSRGLLRHACVEHRCSSRLFGADGSRPASFATRPSPWTLHPSGLPRTSAAHPLHPESGKTLVFITINFSLPAPPSARSTKAAGRWNSSSSGSSSIFGSSSSTARRRTR